MITKTSIKQHQEFWHADYVPKGAMTVKYSDLDSLIFRKTENHEVFQCSTRTGYDIQSGPMYCGKLAEHIAFYLDDRIVTLCDIHYNKLKNRF